ncbi:MAG: cyclic nucleotide-binding domain-containing protein, partial [Gammaproteobacteria bacterium]
MALLGNQVRTATVKAKHPSTLLRLRSRDVMKLAREGTELKRRLTALKEGDFFGEMALLGDQVRTATVKIEEQTALLKLSRADILQLAENNPELKERLEEAKASREIVI